jgi:hypothetical protein
MKNPNMIRIVIFLMSMTLLITLSACSSTQSTVTTSTTPASSQVQSSVTTSPGSQTPAAPSSPIPRLGGGAVVNSDSIITAKIVAIRQQTTGYPWEMDILVQSSVDAGNLPNPTKDKIGQVITVKTDQNLASFKTDQIISAKVKYVGDVPLPAITLCIYNIQAQ